MEFNLAEKLAIIKMIYSMVLADGKVHEGEINEVTKLMDIIDFDSSHIQFAQNIEEEQSIAIIKKMTLAKRNELTNILEGIAKSDGFVHEKETELLQKLVTVLEKVSVK